MHCLRMLAGLAALAMALLGTCLVLPGEIPSDPGEVAFDRGVAARDRALRLLAEAPAGGEGEARRKEARDRLDEAAKRFAEAEKAFRPATAPLGDKPLSLAWERAASAASIRADVLLRAGKLREARDAAATFLSDPAYQRSRSLRPALHTHGAACFFLGDHFAAGRSLNQLAPFTDPEFGAHARYLLARVHHLSGERAEAALHYAAVIADFDARQKQAPETRLPAHVARALYCLGVLCCEQGRFSDAAEQLGHFLERDPQSPLRQDALLCLGLCQLQLHQFPEATETLKPLAARESPRTAQAALWLGKAQLGLAKPEDEDAFAEALRQAYKALTRAAQRYRQSGNDPAARRGRGEALLALAEADQLAGKHADAAVRLTQVQEEGLLPRREEELFQLRITALNRAGNYAESETLIAAFRKKFPRSTLQPEIAFRAAENAWFQAVAADGAERRRLREEAEKRYQLVLDRYPEFELAPVAQFAVARALHDRGDFEKAQAALERIPVIERRGELTLVPYQLADCLIRLAPARADDALAAGKLQEHLETAVELLNGYLNEAQEPPLAADALLRLAFCHERLAVLQARPEEHDRLHNAARADLERLLVDYPWHALQPQAFLERIKGLSEDPKTLIPRLRQFTREPLKKSPIAPLGVVELALQLRTQDNGAREAARLLGALRLEQEKELARDPSRKAWVPVLQYQHAAALRDAGKPGEARALLETMLAQFPGDPLAAEAALRRGQCLSEEGSRMIDEAGQRLGQPDLSKEETAAATKLRDDGRRQIHEAAAYFEKQADELAGKQGDPTLCAAFLYEAAWTRRGLAEPEVADAREQIKQERAKKLQEEAARRGAPGQPAPQVTPPEVPLADVPLQPQEKRLRALYERLLRDYPEQRPAQHAGLELAEHLADRNDHAAAIRVLRATLDREPPDDLADALRLRLALCYLTRDEGPAALKQLEAIARRKDAPLAAQAHLRAGEYLLGKEKWHEAIAHLQVFQDKEEFKTVGGVSDRAMLELGHAQLRLGKWDLSQKAYGLLLSTFAESPWREEASYSLAWVFQKQGLHRQALDGFTAIPDREGSETVLRARLQAGICQVELGRPAEALKLLAGLPGRSTTADLNALLLLETAHAHGRQKQPEERKKLLLQVEREYPRAPWADAARAMLKGEQAPHTLPAAVRLLTPAFPLPAPLDPLGGYDPGLPPPDDPTTAASLAYTLTRVPPDRAGPAAAVRLAVPDPFEHEEAMHGKIPPDEAILPTAPAPRLPGR